MTDNSNGYFFLSHSSKDIEKVRKIRNLIENENGNPILFYLKCLDGDNPTGKDEEQLKDLISREILARKKFILCKSKNTEPPLSSKWIEWEKDEVKKLQRDAEIQVHEVDIEKDEDYLQNVNNIVRKQRSILLVAPYELLNECWKIVEIEKILTQHNLHVESFIEKGDIHNDLLYNFGQNVKDMIKGLIMEYAKKSGIIVLLSSKDIEHPTILQMAYTFGMRQRCSIKNFDISSFDENMPKRIYDDIIELVNS